MARWKGWSVTPRVCSVPKTPGRDRKCADGGHTPSARNNRSCDNAPATWRVIKLDPSGRTKPTTEHGVTRIEGFVSPWRVKTIFHARAKIADMRA